MSNNPRVNRTLTFPLLDWSPTSQQTKQCNDHFDSALKILALSFERLKHRCAHTQTTESCPSEATGPRGGAPVSLQSPVSQTGLEMLLLSCRLELLSRLQFLHDLLDGPTAPLIS